MDDLQQQLIFFAHKYHQPEFIKDDPIQFPRQFTKQQDIEISGLLTAYISFGRRAMIIKSAKRLHELMSDSPHNYVLSEKWKNDFKEEKVSFYRTLSNRDMYTMLSFLAAVYNNYSTMEEWIIATNQGLPIQTLLHGLGLKKSSAQKKLNMFLRWMIRKDSPVDIGCWKNIDAKDLIIPLDTHVHQMALTFGITGSKAASFKTAVEITDYFKEIFPEDPCLGDFALFGMGVNR